MTPLIRKMLKAREFIVETGGHKFTIRRPTALDIVNLHERDGGLTLRNSFRFVVDWDLTELDLELPGGTDKAAPFDSEAFKLWIEDHHEYWSDLMTTIRDSVMAFIEEHSSQIEA